MFNSKCKRCDHTHYDVKCNIQVQNVCEVCYKCGHKHCMNKVNESGKCNHTMEVTKFNEQKVIEKQKKTYVDSYVEHSYQTNSTAIPNLSFKTEKTEIHGYRYEPISLWSSSKRSWEIVGQRSIPTVKYVTRQIPVYTDVKPKFETTYIPDKTHDVYEDVEKIVKIPYVATELCQCQVCCCKECQPYKDCDCHYIPRPFFDFDFDFDLYDFTSYIEHLCERLCKLLCIIFILAVLATFIICTTICVICPLISMGIGIYGSLNESQ